MVEYLIITVVLVLAYAWLGYPLLLTLVKRNGRPRTTDHRLQKNDYDVSVVLSAHNEESVIRERIHNIMDQQLPSGVKLQVLVGSDGSTDMTVATAQEFEMNHKNIKVFEYKDQRGKVAVLKNLIKEVAHRSTQINADEELVGFHRRQGYGGRAGENLTEGNEGKEGGEIEEILVFTDANTEFEDGAIEKLLQHFEDPDIGGVCGRLVFRENKQTTDYGLRTTEPTPPAAPLPRGDRRVLVPSSEGCPQGGVGFPIQSSNSPIPQHVRHSSESDGGSSALSSEGFYWRWESAMKERESALGSCLGANGAIYAVRAGCFWGDVPDNTIVDDFVIGMKVREQGKRMVYEPEAIAYEEFPDVQSEWGRRVRIGAGDYQALALCSKCLLPWYGLFAWSFSSHKVLRWLTPHMGISLLVLSCWLLGRDVAGEVNVYSSVMMRTINHLVLLSLILLTSCAGVGRLMKDSEVRVARFFRLCDYFVMMQAALFVGFLRFCKGDLSGAWTRTPRGKS